MNPKAATRPVAGEVSKDREIFPLPMPPLEVHSLTDLDSLFADLSLSHRSLNLAASAWLSLVVLGLNYMHCQRGIDPPPVGGCLHSST